MVSYGLVFLVVVVWVVLPRVRWVWRHLDEMLELVLGAAMLGIYWPRFKRKANLAIAGPVADFFVYFGALIVLVVIWK